VPGSVAEYITKLRIYAENPEPGAPEIPELWDANAT